MLETNSNPSPLHAHSNVLVSDIITPPKVSSSGVTSSATTVVKPAVLSISSLTGPTSAVLGNGAIQLGIKYTIGDTITNATGDVTKFYLSSKTTIDSSATLLGTDNVGNINAKQSVTHSLSFTYNGNLPAGSYYLLAQSQATTSGTTTTVTSNTKSQGITLTQPDLTITSLTTPSTVGIVAGTPFQLTYTVKNIGNANAGASVTNFYLSSQSTYSPSSATLIGTDNISSLAPGASKTDSPSLTFNGSLAAGTYYLIAQTNATNTVSESNTTNNISTEKVSFTPTVLGWVNSTLQDPSIQSTVTSLFTTDGKLTRNDMISLFKEVESENKGVINSTELSDLQTIVKNGQTLLGMQNYVYVLSNYVVNGNTIESVPGISVGTTATQLDNLLNQWFLGTVHPNVNIGDGNTYVYKAAQGSLFGSNGPQASDPTQGRLGDCYFISTISSIAQQKPQYITNMFINNGDNTYTVRFYDSSGNPEYVTVDNTLPTDASGNIMFAGHYAGSDTNWVNVNNASNIWPDLAEKAYAEFTGNSYNAIVGGDPGTVIQQITNLPVNETWSTSSLTQAQVIADLNNHQIVDLGVNDYTGNLYVPVTPAPANGVAYNPVDNHAYAISSYNPTTNTFLLHNPWNRARTTGKYPGCPGDISLTWAQLTSLKSSIWFAISAS